MRSSNSSLRVANLFFFSLVVCSFHNARAEERPAADALIRVRAIAAGFETQLQMSQQVEVSIVARDERMVSVQRIRSQSGSDDVFIIRLDQNFFDGLSDEELTAAIAHELGHVWISLHHPYLQTEALANEIAMRVVSRESMKKVYAKLWLHLGTTGNLEQLLGSEPKATSTVAASSNLVIK